MFLYWFIGFFFSSLDQPTSIIITLEGPSNVQRVTETVLQDQMM